MVKVLVIGLDGGDLDLMYNFIDDLPNMRYLVENGCVGYLKSCVPFVTFPAWKCYSTGKNPGKLGVFWFVEPDFKNRVFKVNNSRSFKSLELWDYLSRCGLFSCVIDMPTTYPPKKINGIIISNGAPRGENYTYPDHLGKELYKLFNYKIDADYYFDIDKDMTIIDQKNIIRQRFDVAKYLLEKYFPDFMHLTVFPLDHIQHTFWRYMDERDPKYGNVIKDFWKFIDGELGSLLNKFFELCKRHSEEFYIFIISDHGFTKLKAVFQISNWLMLNNYIVLKQPKFKKLLLKLGLTRGKILSIIGMFKLYDLLIKLLPKSLMKKIGSIFPSDTIDKISLQNVLDWDRSLVIPLPQGPVYINKSFFKDFEEYNRFRDNLIHEIQNILDPSSNTKLAKYVYKREELYSGEYLSKAPDIVIFVNEGYDISWSITSRDLWNRDTSKWCATHRQSGIFVAFGTKVKKGLKLDKVNIYDIMPTILYVYGISPPSDIDGRILEEIFVDRIAASEYKSSEASKIRKIVRKMKK